LSVASLEKPMSKIRIIEIVFKGELFLDTFSAHQNKYQALKRENRIFSKNGLIKKYRKYLKWPVEIPN
jgi:hypothetical protein